MRRKAFRKGIWAGLLILFLLSSCDRAQPPERGELEARLEGLIAKIEKLQEENEKLYAERRRLEAQLSAREATERQLSERWEGQLDALLKENQRLQEGIERLVAENRRLTQKTQELEASLTQLEEGLSLALQENAELQKRLEEASKLEEAELRQRLMQLREELLGRRLQQLLQPQSPSEEALSQIEEAIQASHQGSYPQAITVYEELVQNQPDLFLTAPQLRYPLTPEYLLWELLNLKQLAGEPLAQLTEAWEAYIAKHPHSPFTDDVLVRLVDAYSNGLSWSEERKEAPFDPARATAHLKQLWDLAWQGELECEPLLFQEWYAEEACGLESLYESYDSFAFEAAFGYYVKRSVGKIAQALGQGYELQGWCLEALGWYERALLWVRGMERGYLLQKVAHLRGACPGS